MSLREFPDKLYFFNAEDAEVSAEVRRGSNITKD